MTRGVHCAVHVLRHEACPPFMERQAWLLSDEERAQVAQFRFAADRAQRLLARAFLRILLAGASGRAPRQLAIRPDQWGKPSLAPSDDLQFNVSHTGQMIAVAMTTGTAIGVDIEDTLSRRFPMDVCASCFTENECMRLEALAPEPRNDHAFMLWTRKEALLKATGHGFRDDPRHIDVLAPDGSFETPARGVRYAGQRWDLHDFRLFDRWRGASACSMGHSTPAIVHHELDVLLGEWAQSCDELTAHVPN